VSMLWSPALLFLHLLLSDHLLLQWMQHLHSAIPLTARSLLEKLTPTCLLSSVRLSSAVLLLLAQLHRLSSTLVQATTYSQSLCSSHPFLLCC
jgi:hypothetical protein